jgi:predicted TIM-barrel enzyme
LDIMSKILPVIHHLDRTTTIAQANLALNCGADGVFLISHAGNDEALVPLGVEIATAWRALPSASGRHPFVGVNLLNTNPSHALPKVASAGLDGLWVDTPGVTSSGLTPAGQKLATLIAQYNSVKVFGSVAFKYQPEDLDPAKAAAKALKAGMLPTTSGAATGVAPTLDKIIAMSRAAGGELAVASGMKLSNVAEFCPHLSHILVATGVSQDEHHFDEAILRQFVELVRSKTAC